MHKIIKKNRLSENVFDITVSAPLIAEERQAGQFVIVQADNEFSERIPLTIVDADAEKGTIRLIFAAIGASTRALARLKEDDEMVEESKLIIDNKDVKVRRILKDDTNYVAVRDIAEALGYNISNKGNIAVLSKK